jgi:small-conductance mechanosensitive channel
LGDAPESGEEPEDIAILRANLADQLDALRVPRVVAEEAHSQANGLIGEIDKIIRIRQTERLLHRGPSPLNPVYWPEAWDDFKTGLVGLYNETKLNWLSETTRAKISNDLPVITVLSVVGLLLVAMGRRWAERLGNFLRNFGGRGTGVWSFVVSLARIALPLAGTLLLVQAVTVMGVLGVRGALIVEAVPGWALTLLVFSWLSDQLYAEHREIDLLPAPVNRHREMVLYVKLLGGMLVLNAAVDLYGQIENITAASRSVAAFPVILGAAMLLFRVQRVSLSEEEDEATRSTRLRRPGVTRIIAGIRRTSLLLALISPILAGLGYGAAATAIVYPVILSLTAIAIVLILQRFFGHLYGWATGGGIQAARDSMFSVLVGFALTVLAIPVVALIWGARLADITELWSRFLTGFQVGDVRISPTGFLTFVLVFVVGYSITRLLQSGLRTSLLPKTRIESGGQNAIVAFTGYAGIFLAALIAVSSAGLDLSSVAIVAGALSVGIGFGLQNVVSNFVSGIILLIERPIAKGDWIEVGSFAGVVQDISVRSTQIVTFDRAVVIIPNSDLIAGTVTNYTRGKTIGRVKIPVGVAYGTDTRMVEKMLLEIAQAHPMVLADPGPSVVFMGFGADALDFEIRAILRDINYGVSTKSDINHEIARRFGEAGIEIPFAQRDIWLRNPEALMKTRDGLDE